MKHIIWIVITVSAIVPPPMVAAWSVPNSTIWSAMSLKDSAWSSCKEYTRLTDGPWSCVTVDRTILHDGQLLLDVFYQTQQTGTRWAEYNVGDRKIDGVGCDVDTVLDDLVQFWDDGTFQGLPMLVRKEVWAMIAPSE
jgi:hypothetical protein